MNLNQYSTSAAQPGLSVEQIENLRTCVPTNSEQRTIASFLDNKTTTIDDIITEKQNLISLLKEQRQAIITEAVTKGLDPNAPMKDSGIEWIGEIPVDWGIIRFRVLFSFGRGLNITRADLEDEGVPCVSYGEIHSKYGFEINPESQSLKYVNKSYLESSNNSLLNYGDFVFADTSEDVDGSGNFAYVNSEQPVFAGYHTVIVRNKTDNNPRYLAYLFDSIPWRTQIRSKVYGIKVYSITQEILKSNMVILPPIEEQNEIVTLLDYQVATIDSLIIDIATQIEKLKEYRQSLIYEAVTGKIEL